jgi:hypothetical protein
MKIRFKISTQVWKFASVILVVCGLQSYGQQIAPGAEAAAKAATFTTFDPPGSVFTEPNAINPAGTITGFYYDASDTIHGFVRAARDGSFTSFDPPGSIYTVPQAINPAGAITGSYNDANQTQHGFLRAPNPPR